MSKANLLRHPLGVSMTMFKVPDLGSKGGNLLSKFIYLTSSRFPLKSRGPFPTFLEAKLTFAMVCALLVPAPRDRSPKDFEDTITKKTKTLSCHFYSFRFLGFVRSSYPCHRRHGRLDLWFRTRPRFQKKCAGRTGPHRENPRKAFIARALIVTAAIRE